jgi:signal transduction histidine kinase
LSKVQRWQLLSNEVAVRLGGSLLKDNISIYYPLPQDPERVLHYRANSREVEQLREQIAEMDVDIDALDALVDELLTYARLRHSGDASRPRMRCISRLPLWKALYTSRTVHINVIKRVRSEESQGESVGIKNIKFQAIKGLVRLGRSWVLA